VFKALSELYGQGAWDVVWRAGEVLFNEVARHEVIPATEPLGAMRALAAYLKRVGYIEQMKIDQPAPDELEYRMLRPIIAPGAFRLINEGGVPAHISTALMFAALKKLFGLRAELIGGPISQPDGWVMERWRLRR
jgi:hypothetical protein